MLDVAVIGAGPAGLSAAINAVARNKTVAVFGRKKETSWLYTAENVNNHLGMPNMSGKEMIEQFYNHAKSLNIEIKEGRVLQVISMGEYLALNFENDFIEAKTVILATGISKGKYIKNENEYTGKGVSYCATCDGMLYRGKDVVVVGEIEEGEEDANFLSEICNSVTYIYSYKNIKHINQNIKLINGKATEVIGTDFVEGIKINEEIIKCDAIFFIKESTPLNTLVSGLAVEKNAIVVNRLMETNLERVYAVGDCTGWPVQLSKAIGEGLVAAQAAAKYLSNFDMRNDSSK